MEKKVKKSLSDLTHQLTTKAQESETIQSKVESAVPSVSTNERRSRKAPPTRRASGVTPTKITSPTLDPLVTAPKTPDVTTRRSPEVKRTPELRKTPEVINLRKSTRQSTPQRETSTKLEPRMMPKSVKDNLMKSKSTPNTTPKSPPQPIKLAMLAHSPRVSTPPMSPFLMSGTSSPLLSPRQVRPLFEVGDRVSTEGKPATVEKIMIVKNRPYEYLLRIENGPRVKVAEANLRYIIV